MLSLLSEYQKGIIEAISKVQLHKVVAVIEILSKARVLGKTICLFGNGGSASTASHFASDLNKGSYCSRKPKFKAICLSDNIPALTAWANDVSYDDIYSSQLDNFINQDDVVIAISGSGNSPNIIKAVKKAVNKGAITIGFTGFDGGKLKDLVDIGIIVPSNIMEQAEDVHLILEHAITKCLREGD